MDESEKRALVRAIGRAIATKRGAVGISQEKVAEALGVSREAVSRMETGIAVPSVVRIAELAEIFECRIDELLSQASTRKVDQAAEILELLDGLTAEKRAVLLTVIGQLARGLLNN